jgi:hypothetical protein
MSETVADLQKRRRAIYERWRLLRTELKAAETDLKAIDRVLAMVDPAFSASRDAPRATTASRDRLFDHGKLAPAALGALHDLGRPATSTEVAEAMLKAKGLPNDDARLPGLTNRVSAVLGEAATRGHVIRAGLRDNGRTVLWEAARAP